MLFDKNFSFLNDSSISAIIRTLFIPWNTSTSIQCLPDFIRQWIFSMVFGRQILDKLLKSFILIFYSILFYSILKVPDSVEFSFIL